MDDVVFVGAGVGFGADVVGVEVLFCPESVEFGGVGVADAELVGEALAGVGDELAGDVFAAMGGVYDEALDAGYGVVGMVGLLGVEEELLHEEASLGAALVVDDLGDEVGGEGVFDEDVEESDGGVGLGVVGDEEVLVGEVEEAFEVVWAGAIVGLVEEGVNLAEEGFVAGEGLGVDVFDGWGGVGGWGV